MTASVSTPEAFLALLILAVVYGMCWLMWWDLDKTCAEQIGGGGELTTVLSAQTAAAAPERPRVYRCPYDMHKTRCVKCGGCQCWCECAVYAGAVPAEPQYIHVCLRGYLDA